MRYFGKSPEEIAEINRLIFPQIEAMTGTADETNRHDTSPLTNGVEDFNNVYNDAINSPPKEVAEELSEEQQEEALVELSPNPANNEPLEPQTTTTTGTTTTIRNCLFTLLLFSEFFNSTFCMENLVSGALNESTKFV